MTSRNTAYLVDGWCPLACSVHFVKHHPRQSDNFQTGAVDMFLLDLTTKKDNVSRQLFN